MRKGPNLDKLEMRLQELLEVRLVKMLPGSSPEDLVAHQLATAVRSSMDYDDPDGGLPNSYRVRVNSQAFHQWHDNTELLNELQDVINTVASESGLDVTARPSVGVVLDESLNAGDIIIEAVRAESTMAQTRGTPSEEQPSAIEEVPPVNAFFIVGGVKIFPLDRSVVNIGRRDDNHLVLDDPRISRYHAQVRAIRGRFVLFDLNSTGGTFVNGQRITQCVLYPGDVISLSGLSLIFGHDNPPSNTSGKGTEPLRPAPVNDRPTVVYGKPLEENPQS